jgi:hypothetical protein
MERSAVSAIDFPFWPMGDSIPRRLHQIAFRGSGSSPAAIPEILRRNIDHLQAVNPGWEHRLYDDARAEDFIRRHYGEAVLARYLRISPKYLVARADLFRYLLTYRRGGVYLDMKSSVTRPLDETIGQGDTFISARWDNGPGGRNEGFGIHPELAHIPGGELQQWHVIAAAGHPFLRAVIERVLANIDAYRPWRDGVGWGGVLRLTGPIPYTLAIEPLLAGHRARIAPSEQDLGLEFSVVPSAQRRGLFGTHYTRRTSTVVTMHGLDRARAAVHSVNVLSRRIGYSIRIRLPGLRPRS